jgi:DtxR family Mn-dependent transcriptional regulator
LCPLVEAPLGTGLRVARLHERRPEELRYLGGLGLMPEAMVWVEERAPFQGPLMIRVKGALHVLDAGLAAAILVEVSDEAAGELAVAQGLR